MFALRCCLLLLLALAPKIKTTVDHSLVKKYFVELYNEALVRAMREEGEVRRRSNQADATNSMDKAAPSVLT